MSNGYLTCCSLVFSLLITGYMFLKKTLDTRENKCFKMMLILNVIESLSTSLIVFFAYFYNSDIVLKLLNRIDINVILWWCTFFMLYVITICKPNNIRKYNGFIIVFNAFFFGLSLVLDVNIIVEGNILDSNGPLPLMGLLGAIVYIILIIFLVLSSLKKKLEIKKLVPFYALIILMCVIVILRIFLSTVNFISIMLTIIDLLMCFTIENPDLKLIDEIKNSKDISDKTNEEKTLFLYNMTRDIKLLTDNINTKVNNILKEDNIDIIKDKVEYIKEDTNNFMAMVNDVLDISNLDSASIKVYNDKYDIKLLLKELNTMYKEKSGKKGLELRTNIASNIPEYLYGDLLNLKKVLMIIMDTSINNTNKGYIEFNVNTIIKSDVCRLVITVEDSSSGMNADKINKSLNMIDNDINSDNLTSARKLITLIGGTIMVSSQIDKGTKTTIVIDQKIVKIDNNKKITRYENEIRNKRILFVDDNESSKKIIEKILNKDKYKYEIVKSGKECLDKIRNMEQYDIIFLDENMPYLNGYEVITKLNDIKNFNIPVILLTRNNDIEYDDKYKEYGFKDYIIKPINEDNVIEKINKYTD